MGHISICYDSIVDLEILNTEQRIIIKVFPISLQGYVSRVRTVLAKSIHMCQI